MNTPHYIGHLAVAFAELRALAAGDPDPLPDPDRYGGVRRNAFAEMLDEVCPDVSALYQRRQRAVADDIS